VNHSLKIDTSAQTSSEPFTENITTQNCWLQCIDTVGWLVSVITWEDDPDLLQGTQQTRLETSASISEGLMHVTTWYRGTPEPKFTKFGVSWLVGV